MAIQLSVAVRNARLDAIEVTIGTAPTLEIRSGTMPADCATADSGSVLATLTLPSDWMNAASGGAKTLLGTWEDTSADATGTASYFRIKAGATCHMQGTITGTGGGGDMELTDVNVVAAQNVNITTFTLTDANA